MTRTIALIYWVFKTDKKQTTPYLSTCLLVGLLFIMNAASFMLLINVRSVYLFNILASKKFNSWLNTIIITTPILLLFFLLFPKQKLGEHYFSDKQIRYARRNLIISFITSLIILVGLLIKSGIDRGIIK
jgi:hypothetical protein